MEEEDYWTKSDVKKFNFDEDDRVSGVTFMNFTAWPGHFFHVNLSYLYVFLFIPHF